MQASTIPELSFSPLRIASNQFWKWITSSCSEGLSRLPSSELQGALDLLDRLAAHVGNAVLVAAADEERARLTVEGRTDTEAVHRRAVAAAALPRAGGIVAELIGDQLRVGRLPVVLEAVAAAHGGYQRGILDSETPAEDIHEVRAVVQRLTRAPMPEPVPVVVYDVVLEGLHARCGPCHRSQSSHSGTGTSLPTPIDGRLFTYHDLA